MCGDFIRINLASNSDAPHTAFTQLSRAEIMSSPGSDQMDEAVVRMLGALAGDQVGIDPDFEEEQQSKRRKLRHAVDSDKLWFAPAASM